MIERIKNLDKKEKQKYLMYLIVIGLAACLAVGSLVHIFTGGNGGAADLGGEEVVLPDANDVPEDNPVEPEISDVETENPTEAEPKPEDVKPSEPEPKPVVPEQTEPEQIKPEPKPEVHEHNYKVVDIKGPSCTEQGYSVYECACGDRYNKDYKPALGHDYQLRFDKEDNEYVSYRCSRCGVGFDFVPVAEYADYQWIKFMPSECEEFDTYVNHGENSEKRVQDKDGRDYAVISEVTIDGVAFYVLEGRPGNANKPGTTITTPEELEAGGVLE